MKVIKSVIYSMVGVSMVFYTFAFALIAVPQTASAAYGYPTSIGYQGRLKDSDGAALTGTYDFRFNFYIAATGGSVVNSVDSDIDVADITVTNGYFTAPIPITGADLGQFVDDLFLNIEVKEDSEGTYDEMTSRVQIMKTPYSVFTQAIETNTTAPTANLFEGRVYYNPDDNAMSVYTGSAFVQVSNTMDDAYDAFGAAAQLVTVDDATSGLEFSVDAAGDFVIDLQSTGDFVVQDAGTEYVTFDDSGTTTFSGDNERTTESVLAITDAATAGATGDLIDINVTGVSGTDSIDITYSGVATGNAIALNMATNVAGDAINIATSATTGSAIDIISSGAVGAGNGLINIDMASGDWQGNIFEATTGGTASDGNVFDVTLEALDVAVQNMVVTNAAASSTDGWLLDVDTTDGWEGNAIDFSVGGVVASSADLFRVEYTAGAAHTGTAISLIMGSNLEGDAIAITSAATTGDAIEISNTTARTTGQLLNIIDSGDDTASTASTAITASAITDVDALVITTAAQTTGNTLSIDAGASAFTTGSALNIIGSGAYITDADAALFNVDASGISTDGYIANIEADAATMVDAILNVSGDGLTSGKALLVSSTSEVLTSGELANFDYTVSSETLGDKTGQLVDITSSRTNTATSVPPVTDDFDVLSVSRSNIMNGVGTGSLNAAGSVFRLENISTETNGTLIDTASGLEIVMTGGVASGGDALNIIHTGTVAGAGSNVIDITANSMTDNTAMVLSMTGQTGGVGMSITGGGANLTATGKLVDLQMGAATAGTGLNITSSGVYGGGGLLTVFADSATTSGLIAGEGILTASADALTTGTILDITSTSELLSSGEIANFEHIMSAAAGITAKTGQLVDVTSDRENLSGDTVSDDYDALSVIRTNTNGGLGVFNTAGSALRIENISEEDAGTLADTSSGLEIVMTGGGAADGSALSVNHTGLSGDSFDVVAVNTSGSVLDINIAPGAASTAEILDIDLDGLGASSGNVLDIAFGTSLHTGNAIDIDMGTNVEGIGLSVTSAATGVFLEGAAVNVFHTGDLEAGASVTNFYSSGSPSSTSHVMQIRQDTGAGNIGSYGLVVSTTGTFVEALHVEDGVSVFDERIDFGAVSSGENIVGNETDLTIGSGNDIDLAATTAVNVPANVLLTFGDDGEAIVGDGTDLSISSSGILDLTTTSSAAGAGALDLTAAATSAWTIDNGDLTIALNEGDGSGVLLVTVGDVFGTPPSINGDDMFFAAEDDIAFSPGGSLFAYLGGASQFVLDLTTTAPTEDVMSLTNAGAASITDDVGALAVIFEAEDSSSNTIEISSTFGDTDADNDVELWQVIDINPITATMNDTGGVGLEATIYGINIDNLTATTPGDDAIVSSAINVGTGWESAIQGANFAIAQDGSGQFASITAVFDNSGGNDYAVCTNLDDSSAPQLLEDCDTAATADYAERYPSSDNVEFGHIVVPGDKAVFTEDEYVGRQEIRQAVLSSYAYQGPIIGIASNNFGDFTSAGNNVAEEDNPVPIALVGRVPVNVVSEGGDIVVGDFLATSSTPGAAMKATEAGRVIGMALADWDGESETLMVQVINTWYQPPVSESNNLQGGDSDSLASADTVSLNATSFEGSVSVAGHLYGSKDMAGRVRLKAGEKTVQVTFENEYAYTPIVTFSLRTDEHVPGTVWVSDENTTGFVINHSAGTSTPYDLEFNWIAIGVPDLFVSVSGGTVVENEVEVVVEEEEVIEEEVVEEEETADEEPVDEVSEEEEVEEEVVVEEDAEEVAEEVVEEEEVVAEEEIVEEDIEEVIVDEEPVVEEEEEVEVVVEEEEV
jgi:hypothetical protein